MDDTSGALRARAPAIALSGVNLALGRGVARVHILKDIDLNIAAGETVAIVESMKMEIVCTAPDAGTIECLLAHEGQPLAQGQNILALKPSP